MYFFVLLTWLPPHMLYTSKNKCACLGVIRPQDMVPGIHILNLFVSYETMMNMLFQMVSSTCGDNQVRSTKKKHPMFTVKNGRGTDMVWGLTNAAIIWKLNSTRACNMSTESDQDPLYGVITQRRNHFNFTKLEKYV